jgi:hypothetical protein
MMTSDHYMVLKQKLASKEVATRQKDNRKKCELLKRLRRNIWNAKSWISEHLKKKFDEAWSMQCCVGNMRCSAWSHQNYCTFIGECILSSILLWYTKDLQVQHEHSYWKVRGMKRRAIFCTWHWSNFYGSIEVFHILLMWNEVL